MRRKPLMRTSFACLSLLIGSSAVAQDRTPSSRVADAEARVAHVEACTRPAKTTIAELSALLRTSTNDADRNDLALRAEQAVAALDACLSARPQAMPTLSPAPAPAQAFEATTTVVQNRVVVSSQPNVDATFEVVARDIPAGRGAIHMVERVDGDGHADPANVRSAFANVASRVGECLAAARSRGVRGEVELNVTFDAGGAATQAEVEGSPDVPLRTCLEGAARGASIGGGIAGSSVTYAATLRLPR
jgi:hypothetical protein